MKKVVLILMLLVVAYIFPACVEYALAQRGYFAFGGEWLMFVYPFVIISIYENAKKILKEDKK